MPVPITNLAGTPGHFGRVTPMREQSAFQWHRSNLGLSEQIENFARGLPEDCTKLQQVSPG